MRDHADLGQRGWRRSPSRASAPVLQDLNLGNVSLIVTFLAVVAWRFVDRPLGSAAIALAASIRPTMAIFFVWWLVRRQWRARCGSPSPALPSC